MTFSNARRKNGELLAVEIVGKVLRFQIKEVKKHARFKQSLHIWYKKNLTQVTGFCSRIFCVKNVKNTFYVCRYTAVTAITIQFWTTIKVFRTITGKMRECGQHSGVALTALSC